MCQLCVVNTGDAIVNAIIMSCLLQADASAGNRDGTGVLKITDTEFSVWKSKHSANSIPDLGVIVRENATDYPMIGHVRAASRGIMVSEENAHPFLGKRFALAHNGRLYQKDEKVEFNRAASDDGDGDASDSRLFLDDMEADAKSSPGDDCPTIMARVMAKRKGKFALLVYDSRDDTVYVARGKTADLHYSQLGIVESYEEVEKDNKIEYVPKVRVVGVVVNTKLTELRSSLTASVQVLQAMTGLEYCFSSPVEVEKDTVYKLEETKLVKVGTMEENAVTYAVESFRGGAYSSASSMVQTIDRKVQVINNIMTILEWMVKHKLNIWDVDLILTTVYGVGIAKTTPEILESAANVLVPKMSLAKALRKRLAKALNGSTSIYHAKLIKEFPNIQFPYTVNDASTIAQIIDSLEKEKKVNA